MKGTPTYLEIAENAMVNIFCMLEGLELPSTNCVFFAGKFLQNTNHYIGLVTSLNTEVL
jgi:hypothetical protein